MISFYYFQCWFAYSLRTFMMHDWSIEQKWMSILLPLLMLYDSKGFHFFLLKLRRWIHWFIHVCSVFLIYLVLLFSIYFRPCFSNDVSRKFVDSWNVGCYCTSHVLMCITFILVVCLSRSKTSKSLWRYNFSYKMLCFVILNRYIIHKATVSKI